ncbi:hypothetical protein K503DRAFT_868232 [Rhizopogon vinicolor AM-OR11-026]|uniref:FAD-binding domain-containing protein n=1 Tax=Rhizopogon vinicolor AM-OR11-026 TaxID=1314800 RepID=A0A1B7MSA9_9AGAM|nr:hypothetical protein K503DRAFT_868232 [Rhizopogon vinicolor AM-OR11-026]
MGQHGPGIWPRSLELFNFLNVPEVNDLGKPNPPVRSYKPGTLELMNDSSMVPHMEPSPAIPSHTPKLIGQQLLDAVLRRHLERFSCFVETGTELRSFEQSDEGIAAVLAKNEILETFHTKWMIGADGAKGVVRKQLGLTFLGETRDVAFVTGDIRLTADCLDRKHWHRFGVFGDLGVSLRPADEAGEDGWQFYLLGSNLDMSIAQSEERIFETIASLIPTEIAFKKAVWASEFRADIRVVNKFNYGRVFVADAAHVHSPTGGQGLNSGIQDAFALGWKIALVAKGLADKSLLETYTEERLPVISEMLEVTTAILNQTVGTGNMTSRGNPKLFMLGINCRFSSIVLDEFTTPVEGRPINAYGVLDEGHLEAGDRAPDAPSLLHIRPGESDQTTLFSHYRPWYHTVIVFAPSPADATSDLGVLEPCDKSIVRSAVILSSSAPAVHVACPADLVLLDQGGHAYFAYLVEASQIKVFVIRPDGVIGAIIHGAEGARRYFSKIFVDM